MQKQKRILFSGIILLLLAGRQTQVNKTINNTGYAWKPQESARTTIDRNEFDENIPSADISSVQTYCTIIRYDLSYDNISETLSIYPGTMSQRSHDIEISSMIYKACNLLADSLPDPSSLALSAIGCCIVILLRRRKIL